MARARLCNQRTRRDRFVNMLRPFLMGGWHTTRECCDWLRSNSGQMITPTTRELAPCIGMHPNTIKDDRSRTRWRWVE